MTARERWEDDLARAMLVGEEAIVTFAEAEPLVRIRPDDLDRPKRVECWARQLLYRAAHVHGFRATTEVRWGSTGPEVAGRLTTEGRRRR